MSTAKRGHPKPLQAFDAEDTNIVCSREDGVDTLVPLSAAGRRSETQVWRVRYRGEEIVEMERNAEELGMAQMHMDDPSSLKGRKV